MSSNHGRRYRVSKIQDGSQLTGSSNISKTLTHSIKNSNGYHNVFGVSRCSSGTTDIVGCRFVKKIAAKLAEVVITSLFLQIGMSFESFQKQHSGL